MRQYKDMDANKNTAALADKYLAAALRAPRTTDTAVLIADLPTSDLDATKAELLALHRAGYLVLSRCDSMQGHIDDSKLAASEVRDDRGFAVMTYHFLKINADSALVANHKKGNDKSVKENSRIDRVKRFERLSARPGATTAAKQRAKLAIRDEVFSYLMGL